MTSRSLAAEETKGHERRVGVSIVIMIIGMLAFGCSLGWVSHRKGTQARATGVIEGEPTSDIELVSADYVSFTPNQPISGRLTFHNRSNTQAHEVMSCRRIWFPENWPRNPDSVTWVINMKWDEWIKNVRADCGPRLKMLANTETEFAIGHGLITPADALKRQQANGSLPTMVVMGFIQYSDITGLHQTDYCMFTQNAPLGTFYRGILGGTISCNTHIGASKPTPLVLE